MSADPIIAPLVCAFFAGSLGYSVGRILENRSWRKVLATLKAETEDGDPGARDREVLDRVWWRRALAYP